jgi:hypothetical protein
MTNDKDDVFFVFDLVLLNFVNGDDIFELQHKANIIT